MLTCLNCGATYPEGTSVCLEDGGALLARAPATGDALLAPGTLVGEYRVVRRLGAGTFGEVYAGEQPLIGKKVAIKLLRSKFASDPEVVSRFVAEARAVNRIRHPNIVDVFSFGIFDDARHYFVMDLLEGTTLSELLAREGRLDVSRALPILRGIADALDAAHKAGVVHRDLKPDNVFLTVQKDGSHSPRLLDFGIAKLYGDDIAHRTATGVALGTPRYMSPEQCHGKRVDHRADIYALGVVIHEMLTGRRLFQADSSLDFFVKHTTASPEPMSSVCPDMPAALDAPVLAMLAKRPEARPSSAGGAVAALAERARAAGRTADPAPTTAGASLPTPLDPSGAHALARIEAATVREAKIPPAIPSAAPDSSSARDSGARPSVAATPPAGGAALAPRPRAMWPLTAATLAAVALSAWALAQSSAGRSAPAAVSAPSHGAAEAPSTAAPTLAPPVVLPSVAASAAPSAPTARASASRPSPPPSARSRPAAGPSKPVLPSDLERP